jgi:transposase
MPLVRGLRVRVRVMIDGLDRRAELVLMAVLWLSEPRNPVLLIQLHRGERVAVHMRTGGRGRHTTIPRHMPSAHRRYAEWTIEPSHADATAIGPNTATLVALILESRPHPEQGYRACIGLLRPARHYGTDRLETACERGPDIGARSHGSIQSILKHGLDHPPRPMQGELLPDHPNIRRPRYYH